MAGMLPGVEMHRRIRAASQRLHKDTICSAHRHHRFFRSSAEPPLPLLAEAGVGAVASNVGAMDEAALRARRRLEEKLGYLRHSRQTRVQANEGRGTRQASRVKDGSSHLISKLLLRTPWRSHSNKSNSSEGNICAVCLEDLGAEQVMELNCTHKYHSKCLVPWLTSHPNCPSCRTPVEP